MKPLQCRHLLRAMLVAVLLTATGIAGRGAVQVPRPWLGWLDNIFSDDDEDATAKEDSYNMICYLELHPININTATRADIEQLPFLTRRQAEDICEYVFYRRPLVSLGELAMIESLDNNRLRLLQTVLEVGPADNKFAMPKLKDVAKGGEHSLTATLKVPAYKRKGDTNGYLGYPYKHWLRYDFRYAGKVRIGLTASQDAGEPFVFSSGQPGYDYCSAFAELKNIGRIERIVVGRYRIHLGLGLVANTGFSMGKTAMLAYMGKHRTPVSAHSSRSEAGYLQGAAATLALTPRLRITAFASYRKADATLNPDKQTVATLVESGYHRTPAEAAKRKNTACADMGASVAFDKNGWHLAANAIYTSFSRELQPRGEQLYKRYRPRGSRFFNLSADYGYINRLLTIDGETAADRHGNLSTLNSIGLKLSPKLQLTAVHRFYTYRYNAIRAGSFGFGSDAKNESAIFVGATWRPSRRLTVSAYSDVGYMAWPEYGVSQSAMAVDNMAEATLAVGGATLTARYKMRLRQDDSGPGTPLANTTEHRFRAAVAATPAPWATAKVQADYALACSDNTRHGYMLSARAAAKLKPVALTLAGAYFNTSGYNTRMYLYEPGMAYSFASTMLTGHGVRYCAMAKAALGGWLELAARVGVTNYFDRSAIGSSLQRIEASSMADIELQGTMVF